MVMKKNISINISGIIFHIEEDGYKKLKDYLDSINSYFSNYDDSEEIIADIESRIAEIFLEKLDEEGKQVISNTDIDQLISTMGVISDFEAMEEETDFTSAGEQKQSTNQKSQSTSSSYNRDYEPRRLYRDLNHQIVGGVSSGCAHYFNIDPIWMRIAFILSFFAGFGLIVYIIMWIAVPGSSELKEDDSIKKFYRDPDDRVLGGVASGLANYFKTDAIIFRIIFIVLFFGFGTGFLAYIVLWIIGPQAKSLTDKMQMKGEKVTLSNIDSNIKRSKEEELSPKGEGAFTKILLFPFRLIGRIFRALGSALSPLLLFIAAAFRIFIGAIISIIGISVMFSLLVTGGVLLGLHDGDWFYMNDSDFPIHIFYNSVPEIGILFAFAAIFIPFLYVFIAGITIIAKRKVMSSSVGWSILGIWMIAVLGTFATVPNVVRDFRDEGYNDVSETFTMSADTVTLSLRDYEVESRGSIRYRNRNRRDFNFESEFTDLDIRASRDNTWRMDKRATARGRNTEDADRNAEEIEYNYQINTNEIIFDPELKLSEDAKFRFQDLDMTLYIPANQPFKINRDMSRLLKYFSYRYTWWEVYRNTWMFDEDGTLQCLSCTEEERSSSSNFATEKKSFDYSNFSELSIYASIPVNIVYGESYEVSITGSESKFDELSFRMSEDNLIVSTKEDFSSWSGTELTIQIPELDNLNLNDDANITLNGTNLEQTRIVVRNNSRLQLTGDFNKLTMLVLNDGRVDSQAQIDNLTMEVMDKGRFYGYEGEVVDCELTTNSEARARLNVREYLSVDAGGFSSIRYKGSPKLDIKDKSNSAIISEY